MTNCALSMRPCTRYRAWIACSGRIPGPHDLSDPYQLAYMHESIRLYEAWVANAWSNYNRKRMPAPGWSGFTDPAFDSWLQRIYLPSENT